MQALSKFRHSPRTVLAAAFVLTMMSTTAQARGDNPCAPTERPAKAAAQVQTKEHAKEQTKASDANPCAPSRAANPCAPTVKPENPCAPTARGANPCAPTVRESSNPCAPSAR